MKSMWILVNSVYWDVYIGVGDTVSIIVFVGLYRYVDAESGSGYGGGVEIKLQMKLVLVNRNSVDNVFGRFKGLVSVGVDYSVCWGVSSFVDTGIGSFDEITCWVRNESNLDWYGIKTLSQKPTDPYKLTGLLVLSMCPNIRPTQSI